MKTVPKSWGPIYSPNDDEILTLFLFALAVAGIVQLLSKVGFIRRERRGRVVGVILGAILLFGLLSGIF